jgi:hypothetical protein
VNDVICIEKHKRVDEILDEHGKRLDEHDTDIGALKTNEAVHSVQIDSLVKGIDKLVSTIKWLIGILLSGVIGFFFYALEKKIL